MGQKLSATALGACRTWGQGCKLAVLGLALALVHVENAIAPQVRQAPKFA